MAEVDHLVLRRGGAAATAALLADIESGAYLVDWWDGAAATIAKIAQECRDFPLGLTDASFVALAARFETTLVATFDERPFRAVCPVSGGVFTLLPADA